MQCVTTMKTLFCDVYTSIKYTAVNLFPPHLGHNSWSNQLFVKI